MNTSITLLDNSLEAATSLIKKGALYFMKIGEISFCLVLVAKEGAIVNIFVMICFLEFCPDCTEVCIKYISF